MVSGPAWIAGAAAGSPAVRNGLAGAGERVDCLPRVVQLAGVAKVAGWRMMLRVEAAPTTVLRLAASGGGAVVAFWQWRVPVAGTSARRAAPAAAAGVAAGACLPQPVAVVMMHQLPLAGVVGLHPPAVEAIVVREGRWCRQGQPAAASAGAEGVTQCWQVAAVVEQRHLAPAAASICRVYHSPAAGEQEGSGRQAVVKLTQQAALQQLSRT